MDFETLCFNLYNIKKPFKKDGSLSVSGARAYGKLVSMLYDLNSMGVLQRVDSKINKLDAKIDKESLTKSYSC